MLSDEEKKAIYYLKARLYGNEGCKFIDVAQSDLRIFLNLVKKQSKEIEGLIKVSKECIEEKFTNDQKWEDKIKAKIEEYDDKGMTINLANRSAGKTFQQAVHYEVKKVLQSLLEKEEI